MSNVSTEHHGKVKRTTPIMPFMEDKHHHRKRDSFDAERLHDYIESPFNVSIVLTSWFPPAIRVTWNFNSSRDSFNATTTVTVETEGDKNARDSNGNGIRVSLPSESKQSFEASKDHEETAGSFVSSSISTLHSPKSLLKMFQIKYNPIGSRSVTSVAILMAL